MDNIIVDFFFWLTVYKYPASRGGSLQQHDLLVLFLPTRRTRRWFGKQSNHIKHLQPDRTSL